jgi:hypothetical protein
MYEKFYTESVVAEWLTGMLFAFYLSSLAIDFFSLVEEAQVIEEEKMAKIFARFSNWDEESLIAAPSRARVVPFVLARSNVDQI